MSAEFSKRTRGPYCIEGPDDFGDYNLLGSEEYAAVAAIVSNLRDPLIVAANAAYIVHACNNFDAVVEALQNMRDAFMSHTQWAGEPPEQIKAADAALAAATKQGER